MRKLREIIKRDIAFKILPLKNIEKFYSPIVER